MCMNMSVCGRVCEGVCVCESVYVSVGRVVLEPHPAVLVCPSDPSRDKSGLPVRRQRDSVQGRGQCLPSAEVGHTQSSLSLTGCVDPRCT